MKTTLLQFKANVDLITHNDVLLLRERKAKHALDLESLELTLKQGDEFVAVMQDFLESLNFSSERIENVECRRRDGFIPHSYNHGGLDAYSDRDQYSCCQNTGFEATDKVLAKYSQYAVDAFKAENPTLAEVRYSDWSNEDQERLQEFEMEYMQEDAIQFQARIIMTSATSANVDFYVSASDTPYHRKSDDKLELNIEFKTPAGMRRKLAAILKYDFVQYLIQNVREAY